ncbi:MAG TPA: hypothetical protein DEO84_06875 [candidate division Zixibacteria bacterium]|jgi:hypothetical protein|nr:hypothetical protein [candidate division Zixibacteria bacterium]
MRYHKLLIAGAILAVLACTPYVITTPLKVPFNSIDYCTIGLITDELPTDMDLEKKPTLEEIDKLKDEIDHQLSEQEIFQMIGRDEKADYEVNGSVLNFSRGSGVARFFIGFGVGSAKLTVALRLVDKSDSTANKVVFAGNFSAQVSDWATKGDQMYKTTAINFAKALKKELKRLDKESSN